MTPYEIGVLLHYYARVDDHPDIQRNPPIWRPTIDDFKAAKLLATRAAEDNRHEAVYVLTSRGRAYMDVLQAVPLPSLMWVMPSEGLMPTTMCPVEDLK